jgi:hypothetical protein
MEDSLDSLANEIARDVIEQISPRDVASYDKIASAQMGKRDPGSAATGLGLEALAGTLLVAIYPEVRSALKRITAAGLLYLETQTKRWIASQTDEQNAALPNDRLRKLINEVRTNVIKNGFSQEQADALELVLVRRLLIKRN